MHFKTLCCFWQTLAGQTDEPQRVNTVQTWFASLSSDGQGDGSDLLALSSCLFPHRRPDRVYGLREKSLVDIATRAWGIGPSRAQCLRDWQSSHDAPDFATTLRTLVEEGGVMSHVCGPPTVEEVDHVLSHLASACPFSSPRIRDAFQYEQHSSRQELTTILQRMSGLEAEWMCRLILGNLGHGQLPEELVMNLLDPGLWAALQVHDGLSDAVAQTMALRKDEQSDHPCQPTLRWRPQLGIAIRRPTFEKARSVQHCCQLLRQQVVCVERKYDGEYCQIHVQLLGTGAVDVKIFSKSGRNSTADRKALIPIVHRCLAIGTKACRLSTGCVLVGELVVWSEAKQDIMPFYKIRRYVSRAGRSLGTARDSPPLPDEHLMVVLFDCLLHDDTDCALESYVQRRQRLVQIVRPIPGHVMVGDCTKIDISGKDAPVHVAQRLAHAISHQWEGLVFKPCQTPYLSLEGHQPYQVKMRKDMIPGLGDTADLVVIGGRLGTKRGVSEWWTTFYLACVDSKADSEHGQILPSFSIIATVSRPAITTADMRYLNRYGKAHYLTPSDVFLTPRIRTELAGGPPPSAIFMHPLVVEVVGAGFDRLPNSRFESLRFPRIVKVHLDRSFADATTTEQYMQMAAKSKCGDINNAVDSFQYWVSKLNGSQDHLDVASSSASTGRPARRSRKRRRDVEEVAVTDAGKKVRT